MKFKLLQEMKLGGKIIPAGSIIQVTPPSKLEEAVKTETFIAFIIIDENDNVLCKNVKSGKNDLSIPIFSVDAKGSPKIAAFDILNDIYKLRKASPEELGKKNIKNASTGKLETVYFFYVEIEDKSDIKKSKDEVIKTYPQMLQSMTDDLADEALEFIRKQKANE